MRREDSPAGNFWQDQAENRFRRIPGVPQYLRQYTEILTAENVRRGGISLQHALELYELSDPFVQLSYQRYLTRRLMYLSQWEEMGEQPRENLQRFRNTTHLGIYP
jgi:plasmid replication initiation protein